MPDQTPRPSRIVQPESVHPSQHVGYSHVARAGNTLYLAGQVALDKDGKLVGPGDVQAQTHQVYANIQAIIEEMGGTMADIVKLTTYLTDRDHLEGFRAARNAVSPQPFPPNTLLFIDGLAHPDWLVEIEAVAVLGE